MDLRGLRALLRRAVAPVGDAAGSDVVVLPAELVRAHRLGPLAHALGYLGFGRDYTYSGLLARVREQVLAEAISALSKEGIATALLKGASYAGWLYQEPAERPMGDLDLLVPGQDFRRARSALLRIGYRDVGAAGSQSSLHHAVTLKRHPAAIDLHRSMIQPLRSRLDLAGIWRRASPARERHDGALRLDVVDEALLHFAHVARHELRVPAINYVDGGRLLERLGQVGQAELMRRARLAKLRRAVAAAIATTAVLTGVPLEIETSTRAPLLPPSSEVLEMRDVSRALVIARKAVLLDGPAQLAGLALVYLLSRAAPRAIQLVTGVKK